MTNEKLLIIEGLCANAGSKEVLKGVDIQIRPSEVHAVMGPNGSGKSTLAHVLMGRPGYKVTSGSITVDGIDILPLKTWERAQAGMFIAMHQPIEVPTFATTFQTVPCTGVSSCISSISRFEHQVGWRAILDIKYSSV